MSRELSLNLLLRPTLVGLTVLAGTGALLGQDSGEAAVLDFDHRPARLGHTAPFQARLELPLPAKPEGVCAGDFNGDGKLDLAATLVSPGALLVWHAGTVGLEHDFESHPCGGFPLPPVALPCGTFGTAAAIASIAVASRATRTLEIFSTSGRSLALERTPRALAAGKAGGKVLIAVACDGRRMEVLRDGAEALELWTLSGDLPRCAFVSTGLAAVLVGYQDSTAVEAYAADDAAPIGRIELGGIPRAMAELDVDGDGDLELALASGDHELSFFGVGTGGGARSWFERREPLVCRADAIPTALAVADFDSDGRADLALLNDFSLSLQLLTQLSAAGAARRPSLYAGQTPSGIAILDIDGDGRLDFAVGNRDTLGLGLLPGDGAGSLWIGTNLPMGSFPQALAAAQNPAGLDVLRLVALNVKANSISAVVLKEGTLRPLPEVPCGSEPRAPLIAELDGLPGLDVLLLVAGQHGAELRRFHGDVEGRLTLASTLELGGGASDVVLLDVDGDAAMEVAISDPRAGVVLLMDSAALRAEPGALVSAARLSLPSMPRDLVAIELDGDAAPELACVLAAPGERVGIAWLDARRDSSGDLRLVELGFSALSGAPSEAAACDLNGDGRMDLAVLTTRAADSSVGAWLALLRGPAGPSDFHASALIATSLLPRGIAAGDVDGDGRAEVFVAVQNSTLVQAWSPTPTKAGTEFNLRALDSLGAGLGPFDLCLSDVDGDGWIDLCVANAFSNDMSVLHGKRN